MDGQGLPGLGKMVLWGGGTVWKLWYREMMLEGHRAAPHCGVDMGCNCGVFIAVGRCVLVVIISLVTQPF